MARTKVSEAIDPVKVAEARQLLASNTLSQLIDVALDRLIVAELERRHVHGCRTTPPGADEQAWSEVERDQTQIADDVDWAFPYGLGNGR